MVVAAGRGVRFGSDTPKQFADLAGRPLVLWAVDPFLRHEGIRGVVIVVPRGYVDEPPPWLAELRTHGAQLVAGGAERADSVRAGLEATPEDAAIVAVHDGVRPLVTGTMISSVLGAVTDEAGAIAARRVTDTLKAADSSGCVLKTVDREGLWRAETPQAFPRDLITDLHRRAGGDRFKSSDCAGLCEEYDVRVHIVELEEPNLKVTTATDLALAEAWLDRSGREARYDSGEP